jgi:hypothetical protein
MNNTRIGTCGDNCVFCPRYIATQNGSVRELGEVKELWVRLGLRDPAFPVQDMACSGCEPENKCAYPEIRTCAYGKGVENCGLCHAYPCKLIHTVFEKTEAFRSHAVRICMPKEMDALHKAFFSKRQNLDQMRLEMRRGDEGVASHVEICDNHLGDE